MQTNTPFQQSWRRLRKNKPALLGLGVILLAILIAFLAYFIAPDHTPNANDQIPEIDLQSPGFSVEILQYRKNIRLPETNIFQQFLYGKASPYKSIPAENSQILGDSLFVKVFSNTADYTPPIYKAFHLVDVIYPLSIEGKGIQKNGNQFSFTTVDGKNQTTNREELLSKIEKQITNRSFLFGTDRYGRDVLSRLIVGIRISLLVGLVAVLISLTIGVFLGAMGGYFGGRIDDMVQFLINTIWSIPTLLLVFAIVLALGKNIVNIFIAVGLTMWVDVARIVRGQVLSFKTAQFVEAARSMGFSHFRILFRHILPNILGPVMVVASANFATAILIEAGLSYLGFGIQPPAPSWGTMLNENYGFAISGHLALALIPAAAIAILVLAFNLLGNGIRDALDVKG